MEERLHILLVDDDPRRAALVDAHLREAGFVNLRVVQMQQGLLHQIERDPPDVIVMALESPGRDILESLSVVSSHNPTPIVMFTEEDDPDFIRQAVDAGVSAYVVEGIRAEKVKPIIDVAMAQFRSFQQLRSQLADSRTALTERRDIERAKGVLMDHHGYTESRAHECMRSLAMSGNLKLVEVAQQVLESHQRDRRKRP